MEQKKRIAVLGSTGSIGSQSLMVCRNREYTVEVLTAGKNIKLLEKQAREFLPQRVVVADESRYTVLKTALADTDIHVEAGPEAVCEAAALPVDVVINAIVGIAGLRPTLAALEAGNQLALSNKESLVAGGKLVMAAARQKGIVIAPVDSEHSAIFQCLQAGERGDVRGVILTASGGPFVGKTRQELAGVERKHALAHPNWSMGPKITIDSATLMNKGLELVEAMWLFDLAPEQIEVVVHRQSVIHSAVEFVDGSVIAQMGVPDMRMAIQYAITHPRRYATDGERLSLTQYRTLTFEPPDTQNFPCLAACQQAAKQGGLAPCIVNGANEQAVALFLEGKIGFLQIGDLVSAAAQEMPGGEITTLADIEQADQNAREFVLRKVAASG